MRRLDAAWRSADLEADEGVVDAFVGDAEAEATMLASELRRVERRVRKGIARCVEALKAIEGAVYDDHVVLGRSDAGVDLGSLLETARRGSGVRLDEHKEEEGGEGSDDDNAIDEDWDVDVLALLDAAAYYDDANDHGSSGGGIRYAPRRTGGVDRLLTKLDFGHWLDDGDDHSLDDEG